MGLEPRICTNCKNEMIEGYVVGSGDEYYCTDKCLHENYTPKKWDKMSTDESESNYWTSWVNDDDPEIEIRQDNWGTFANKEYMVKLKNNLD